MPVSRQGRLPGARQALGAGMPNKQGAGTRQTAEVADTVFIAFVVVVTITLVESEMT